MNKMNENSSPVEPADAAVDGSSVDEAPAEERPVLTVDEVAQIFGVSTKAIYALVKQPFTDFPSFKVGKRILIPRRQLNEWIQRECAKPSA